jgi:hypothetical protein
LTIVGHRIRSQSSKHLALAIFADQRQQEGETWEESMHRWNDDHPEWKYSRPSNFWRDADRAPKRFVEQRPSRAARKRPR